MHSINLEDIHPQIKYPTLLENWPVSPGKHQYVMLPINQCPRIYTE